MVPVPKDMTMRILQKKYLGIESNIIKQQQTRNKNNDFHQKFHTQQEDKRQILRIL